MAGLPKDRHRVLGLLVLLFGITYLDRVCISVAGPLMQRDLHIGPVGWGWVTGMFTVSYCLFEIPTGVLGDRIGPRRVLTRIVIWWSAFTALTGAVSGYVPLLITRFLFGAGEAGAFPNASIVVSRWFPPARRATMCGVLLMSSQIGGALAPLLVVPIQSRYGWRVSFFAFGALGIGWASAWYAWFRDTPPHDAGQVRESAESRKDHSFPWGTAFRSPSALALLGTAFCYVYVYNFFQTWFHTFLVKGRGFSETGLGIAGVFTLAAMLSRTQVLTVIFLTVVYGGITFQQSGVFGVCLDIGKRHAGAMVGLMNASAQVGGLVGAVAYGYIVEHFGSYDAPFVPMAALLFLGALLWLRIDASQELHAA